MQIKPHQIKHFAEQQRRFKENTIHALAALIYGEEEGSYFSKTLKFKPNSLQLMNAKDAGIDLDKLNNFSNKVLNLYTKPI